MSESAAASKMDRWKFRWIKWSVDGFDDEKIKLIESMPDGDAILVIWLKLIAQAGRCNAEGFIILNDTIPYTPEMLAKVFNRSEQQIKYALLTFEKFRMVQMREGAIYVTNFLKHHPEISEREKTRLRVQKHRNGRKAFPPASSGPEDHTRKHAEPQANATAPVNDPSREALASKWGAVHKALMNTGKFVSLNLEHLYRVSQEHPKAELAANFGEIVNEAAGVAGQIGSVMPWLRKAVSGLERRVLQRSEADARKGRGGF